MAFQTTQQLDSMLLRSLSFRTPLNYAISSQYIMYANGQGQTYWSNAVLPSDLSTLSTAIGQVYTGISSCFSTVGGFSTTLNVFSTNINNAVISTGVKIDDNYQQQINFQVNFDQTFQTLANQLALQVNNVYNSSLVIVNSTVYGISSISSFYTEISNVQDTVNSNYILNINYTNSAVQASYIQITNDYIDYFNTNVGTYISTVSSAKLNVTDFAAYSSATNQQLIALNTYIFNVQQSVSSQFSTLYLSTISPIQSTILNFQQFINSNAQTTSSISTLVFRYVSTLTAPLLSSQTSTFTNYYRLNSSAIVSTNMALSSLSTVVGQNRTNVTFALGLQQVQINSNTTNIAGLQLDIATLTTSSILYSTYVTFNELAYMTSTLINSTINSVDTVTSNIYYSTAIQNTSISMAFFNSYTSSLYWSTYSTVLYATSTLMSQSISTLYASSQTFLLSSFDSTISGTTSTFNSTIYGLASTMFSSLTTQLDSSIIAYISAPTAAYLSTYDYAISSFLSTGYGELSTMSTTFGISYVEFSTLYDATFVLYDSLDSNLNSFTAEADATITYYDELFSNVYVEGSTQVTSSVVGVTDIYNAALVSTTDGLYVDVVTANANALANIEGQTLSAYDTFVNQIDYNIYISQLSTLYTNSTIQLTGSNFVGVMDLSNYMNFNVQVFGISSGVSNYKLTYCNIPPAVPYQRGIITIDVSTVGFSYSNFNTRLMFDTYKTALTNMPWTTDNPIISSADYTAVYQYTIMNNAVYTNLLNFYPRIALTNLVVLPVLPNVTKNGLLSASDVWRGSRLNVSWSNYMSFPYNTGSTSNFQPQVVIEVSIDNQIYNTYGPIEFTTSNAVVQVPYLRGMPLPLYSTNISVFVLGLANSGLTKVVNTIVPQFTAFTNVAPSGAYANNFLGGQELVAVTDRGKYPLYGVATAVITNTNPPAEPPSTFFNSSYSYTSDNLTNSLFNLTGFNGTSSFVFTYGTPYILNQFELQPLTTIRYWVSIQNYFEYINELVARGSVVTLTLTGLTASLTFIPTSIFNVNIGNYIWQIDTNIAAANNPFVEGDVVNFTYTVTVPPLLSNANVFAGPYGTGVSAPGTTVNITNSNLQSLDAVSTLYFYELLETPIKSSQTYFQQWIASVSYNDDIYSSTITITGPSRTPGTRYTVLRF